MNEEELLELAAKACRFNVYGSCDDVNDRFTALIITPGHGKKRYDWNPLRNDGMLSG